ncbi:MAG: UDP-2,3-diacylglucosamine diphosphatase [Bacteroidales bacterium]|nr:UDP-2,3-diacylglucosamine diphosphatase [Bacteroidales bacterium]MDD2425022.1 UDP-2,3-diacylglucosamine diphosphatase [Bacteroidales bacterium]MDD3989337.1 UDP-2,3-diacylglucosamine diphosphatase [Bacteroidales bacterium]
MSEMRNLHFFVSDVHLGLKRFDPREREEKFLSFLETLPGNTSSLYLLGDIFDFWFEYRFVVPRGFTRILAALSNLGKKGVDVIFFKGNHDMWTFGYLEEETGLKIMKELSVLAIGGKKFCLAHGDTLTSAEPLHNLSQKLFRSKFLQKMLSAIHPSVTFSFAHRWSENNRVSRGEPIPFRGKEDPLYGFSCDFEKRERMDYFIFGHMHTPGSVITPQGARMYILGDWLRGCEYLCFDEISGEISWKKG